MVQIPSVKAPVPTSTLTSHLTPESISLLIRKRDTYIDTVSVYVGKSATAQQVQELREMAGGVSTGPPMKKQERKWPVCLRLQQPKPLAFDFINSNFERVLVTRLDIALDLVVDSVNDARLIHAFLDRHQFHRRQVQAKSAKYKGTTYSAPAGSRNVCTIYADKPYRRKQDGDPGACCHVEWRMEKSSSVRAAGLADLSELADFDLREFCKHRLCLKDLPSSHDDLRRLGRSDYANAQRKRTVRKDYGKGIEIDWDLRVGSSILRASISGGEGGDGMSRSLRVQDAVKYVRDRLMFRHKALGRAKRRAKSRKPVTSGSGVQQTVQRLFPNMPIDWLLPEPGP